ncbi:MAG: U32 family peptidase [Candidatus Marinimicrobia bacterium]|nr:U32 family peptidase [Candidatus Neomarinimicrobiota bacterium]
MKNIPELLAPAGNLNAAITAFEHGADAVYAGLDKFNARERTENFSYEDYGKLMAYAGKHGKKVYLTFNTLIKENELREVLGILHRITRLSPDAVITQDIGVISMLKQYFPHIPVHASTQMGIHNSAGVAMAEKLGIERIILERQVSMEELALIQKNSSIELEVFIHGALCCSLSGACLFSSWMGGHSGNRGKCKQPCRRRYFSPEGNGFFFSTNDLYTLENIPALKRAGIVSLKIEGRLRKSDYVAATVQAYRMILDAEEKDINKLLPEARAILSGGLGRKWSSGFYDKEQYDSVIESQHLGVSGKQCGQVLQIGRGGFMMQTSQPVKLKDKIRIQPKSGLEGPALTITKISKNGKSINYLRARDTGFIHCDKPVSEDGLVYKIGIAIKEYKGLIEQLPILENTISLQVDVQAERLQVKILHHPHMPVWETKTNFPKAENRAVPAELFIKEFKKTGFETLGIKDVAVNLNGDYFALQRDIRKYRQTFETWLQKNYIPVPEPVFSEITPNAPQTKPIHTVAVKNREKLPKGIHYDRLALHENLRRGDELILPVFCPEDALPDLRKRVEQYIFDGLRYVRLTSLYQFDLFSEHPEVTLHTGFPLPVTNHLAGEMLCELGANTIQLWVELEKPMLLSLTERMPGKVEIYRYGCLPILQTRAILPVKGSITDARGAGFTVETGEPLTCLYPEAVFSIPLDDFPPVSTFTDLTHAIPGEKTVSIFNFDREMA